MALETKHRPREKDEGATDAREKEREKEETIEDGIAACRAKLYHPLISAATRGMYETMFDEIREKQKDDWAKDSAALLQRTIDQAVGYQASFEGMLTSALAKKTISAASYARWMERFNDPSLLECTRKEFVKNKFPAYVRNWEHNAAWRKKLLSKFKGAVDKDDEPSIAILEDENAFLALDYHKQKNLLATLDALDAATLKDKKELFAGVRTILSKASNGEDRYLHPAKTGILLKQMMEADDPEAFREETLEPSLERYRETRLSYDAFEQEIENERQIAFKLPPLNAFLHWEPAKRSSFLSEGKRRIATSHAERAAEADKDRLLSIKLIEKRMDMQDWKGADIFLADALEAYPEDKDLAVMQDYIESHRTDTEEKEQEDSLEDVRKDIDAMMKEIPYSARGMCVAAIEGGPDTFGVVVESMYRGAQEIPAKETEMKSVRKTKKPAARIVENLREEEDETVADAESDEEPEEIVLEQESDDDQAAALEALTGETLFDNGQTRKLTFSNVSAEQQMMLHTQLYLPMLDKLRYLHSQGERYECAA